MGYLVRRDQGERTEIFSGTSGQDDLMETTPMNPMKPMCFVLEIEPLMAAKLIFVFWLL